MNRDKLEFKYFFNAGLDRTTGICDGEGSDIYEIDDSDGAHYIGSLYGYLPSEVSGMSDGELEEVMAESGIFTNAC